jgi:hypothetical protein
MNKIAQRFYEEGLITKEAAERLSEFDGLLKEAGFVDKLVGVLKHPATQLLAPTGVALGAGVAAPYLITQHHFKKQREQELAQLESSFTNMAVNSPQISRNRDRAQKRFQQIAHFSPTVAKDPEVAGQLVAKTLDNGLSEDDVRKLVQIEHSYLKSRSMRKQDTPRSAKILETMAPRMADTVAAGLGMMSGGMPMSGGVGGAGAASGIQQQMQANAGTAKSLDDRFQKMDEKSREYAVAGIVELLAAKRKLPQRFSDITEENVFAPENISRLTSWIKQDPQGLFTTIRESGLANEVDDIMDEYTTKEASAPLIDIDAIPLEKRAHILADQYTLLKVAKLDKAKALFGLGAATLFGAGSAIVEKVTDYKRSQNMNEKIENSWTETQKKLKQLSEDGTNISLGIDYNDNETKRKAREAYKVLVDVAPTLATNPTVATPFVNRVVQNEGDISPDLLKMLSETQRNINTSRNYRSPFADDPAATGFGRGFSSAGGTEFIKSLAKAD